ncbi:MAG: HAMP domain-containing protein [Myxococcaceae bacterium]|nr:HAMP domain-containing protein [Myxococcaceae bacterium]
MSVRRRLWLGYLANLAVLPVFFLLTGWALSDSDVEISGSAIRVQHARLARSLADRRIALGDPAPAQALEPLYKEAEVLVRTDDPVPVQTAAVALRDTLRPGAGITAAVTRDAAERFANAVWAVYDGHQDRLFAIKQRTVTSMALVVPLALSLAILASVLLSRSILRPLEMLTQASTRMAEGDLREDVELPRDRELRVLAEAFNLMRARLAMLFIRMRTHSRAVSEVAAAVNQAANEMTRGVQQQSAATEETSSAMEEIAAQIQGVSQNAVDLANDSATAAASARQIAAASDAVLEAARALQQALERSAVRVDAVASTAQQSARDLGNVERFARDIDDEALSSGQALDESIRKIVTVGEASRAASEAFDRLGTRSRQITGVVETMAEIADQTNLLALNAAIEAARAGDSGRGFAVVAEEVRKLAERSLVGAKEVAQLVSAVREDTDVAVRLARENAAKTDEGTRLLSETGGRMRKVVESVRRASELLSRVAAAVGDQSKAAMDLRSEVEQLTRLAGQLSGNAQTQAAGAAEVVKAVERMSARTRQVADATVQVRAGGDQVLKAVEDISVVARQNQEALQRVTQSMQSLGAKVAELQSNSESLQVKEAA